MARIRTIKPEFFTSEDIVNLSPLARLLYIALWCEADREGRMAWKPKTFKMRYIPADSCNIEKLCFELLDAGLIVQYGAYAFIPSFHAHQHLNPREAASQFPEPEIDACPTRAPRDSDASARDSDATVTRREEGKGREGKGKEGVTARGSRLPENFEPDFQFATESKIQNPPEEFAKFRDYWNSQPGQKGVKLDWLATWRNWCRNAKQTTSRYLPPQPSDTVPAKPGLDPALAKIMADQQRATKPPAGFFQKREVSA